MKKPCRTSVALSFAGALTIAIAQPAMADNVKIKIADSFPVGHYIPEYFVKPLMEQFKAKNRNVDFEYYPAEQLGKSKDMLQLTQAGVVDIGYVAPAFVTDKMPLSVVAELPLDYSSSCKGTLAYWKLAKPGGLIAKKEFEPNGVRLLFTIVLPPYQLLTKKPFQNLKDLEGQKIRTSGSAKELALKKLGTVPIQIPTPDVYEALSRGTIDGMLFPFNSLPPYELHKVAKYSTVGENFGSFVANYVISEKKFAALPAEVQTALTDMGEQFVKSACEKVENDEARDIEISKKAGVTLVTLPAADKEKLKETMATVAKDWADNMDRRGRAGTEALNAFKAGLK
ncbi:MAG: TRAP transporter substrate-binding protein DctP [Burkholderiales bacterium]